MVFAHFDWVPDELFTEAKSLRKSILQKKDIIDNLDNKDKNVLLEYYHTAQIYAGLELDFVEKRIKQSNDSTRQTSACDLAEKKSI